MSLREILNERELAIKHPTYEHYQQAELLIEVPHLKEMLEPHLKEMLEAGIGD